MLFGRMNLRRGEPKAVRVYAGDVDILLGDLVGITDGAPVPASETTWDNNLETTQKAFVATFLGVALDKQIGICDEQHPALWLVGAAGDYTFTVDALDTGLTYGQLVGPAENEDGDGLEADKVVAVSDADAAVGVIVEPADEGATQVLVRIRSELADRVLV